MNLKLIQQGDFSICQPSHLNLLWRELLYIFRVYNVRAAIMKEWKPGIQNIWILTYVIIKNKTKHKTDKQKNTNKNVEWNPIKQLE